MFRKISLRKDAPFHIMLLPGLILILIFSYVPMAGIIMAFQNFIPAKGLFGHQEWIGTGNFKYLMSMPDTLNILYNTVYIAFFKITTQLLVPLVIAILLNEVKNVLFKRVVQTAIYFPYFLSWVILAGVLIDILSPSGGVVNNIIGKFGVEPIFFLGDNKWFRTVVITSNIWKEAGFNTVAYLAAITSIDMNLYESAVVDGAGRWRQIWNVTLPGMQMIIIVLAVLSLGNILNAGFDQIFNLYSPITYQTGDILDTFIFRIGMIDAQYGVATAVGLFKSMVSLVFISVSYYLAYRFADYRVF